MSLKIMSWNMAGAKLLGKLSPQPQPVAVEYIDAYKSVWSETKNTYLNQFGKNDFTPDIILLQECIGFIDTRGENDQCGRWQKASHILESIFSDYSCFFFPSVSSHKNPHPAKWEKYNLPKYIEAQQGYGICVKTKENLRKLWITNKDNNKAPGEFDIPEPNQYQLCFEAINTTTGAYLGTRDTEPRLAVLGRMKLEISPGNERYINFLNIHLTTLKGEREGNIKLNRVASETRLTQLNLILNNVISAYQGSQEYRVPRISEAYKEDIWVIAGDFNATPDSVEISLIRRMGFIDGNPIKQLYDVTGQYKGMVGTKWSLDPKRSLPPTVVDYIFFGLEQTAFAIGTLPVGFSDEGDITQDYRRPFRPEFTNKIFETDHAVMFAALKV